LTAASVHWSPWSSTEVDWFPHSLANDWRTAARQSGYYGDNLKGVGERRPVTEVAGFESLTLRSPPETAGFGFQGGLKLRFLGLGRVR